MAYVMNNGLKIGIPYGVRHYPAALNPATGGCRNMTGQVDEHGIVTIYAVTSTISPSGDQGADPNLLVKVRDRLDATTGLAGGGDDGGERLGNFVVIKAAKSGKVLRGVAFAPRGKGDN
jgi:hypothetical protein